MISLYPFSPDTRIYIGDPQPWPLDPVETDLVGEPVYALLSDPPQSAPDAPPDVPEGMLARRLNDDSGWELVHDTLGIWYDSEGQRVHVDSLETDVSAFTRIPPPNDMSMLVDGEWADDPAKVSAAAKSAADSAVAVGMSVAARQIAVLQDAVELGMATQAESDAYTAWRRYRVLLSRAQSDPAYPDVVLPVQPEKVVS